MNLEEEMENKNIPLLYRLCNEKARAYSVKEYRGNKDCERYLRYEDVIEIAKEFVEQKCREQRNICADNYFKKDDYEKLNDPFEKLYIKTVRSFILNSPLATKEE